MLIRTTTNGWIAIATKPLGKLLSAAHSKKNAMNKKQNWEVVATLQPEI